ncbi:hypothetical protein S245_029971, partial [Arachis hypogaea]
VEFQQAIIKIEQGVSADGNIQVLELAGNSFSAIELALSFLPCFELRSLLFFNFSLFANFKCRLGKSQPQLKICSGNNKQE